MKSQIPITGNENLNISRTAKRDEFYTQYADIVDQLQHYKDCFRGKVVYCNCDDYKQSEFVRFFKDVFVDWGLKKLIATHYVESDLFNPVPAIKYEYNDCDDNVSPLKEDGDFRSSECLSILREADIIVTNPPFSLLYKYIQTLMEYNKKFLIIASIQILKNDNILEYIKSGQIQLARIQRPHMWFRVPQEYLSRYTKRKTDVSGEYYMDVPAARWITNLDIGFIRPFIPLTKKYCPNKYKHYDNYNILNIDKVVDIPNDYYEEMGVPITFLDKYNPDQFKLLRKIDDGIFDGKAKYARLIIKRKDTK